MLLTIGSKAEDLDGQLAEVLARLATLEEKIVEKQVDNDPRRAISTARPNT
jgi:hypothetical protein